GVKFDKFSQLMNSQDAENAIKEDEALADKLGIQGTPTFYVNGVELAGAQPFQEFQSLIDKWREKLRGSSSKK
ncbi:MAG: DsbA family protein, partial [Deltaproteobacteria bacterium]|nr:DsbA family protein [Deltaproteobacteria bacterium]